MEKTCKLCGSGLKYKLTAKKRHVMICDRSKQANCSYWRNCEESEKPNGNQAAPGTSGGQQNQNAQHKQRGADRRKNDRRDARDPDAGFDLGKAVRDFFTW